MTHQIPQAVRDYAKHDVIYLGKYNGKDAYMNVFPKEDNGGGFGYPFVYLLSGDKVTTLSTAEDSKLWSFINKHS